MAVINIFGIIGEDVRAQDIVEQIDKGNTQGIEAEPINVNIMSDGGDVVEGMTIFNALKRHEIVNIHIEFAASIAATIAMAGTHITMAANGRLMIHNPMAAKLGQADDMRKMADRLDGAKTDIIKSFSRTGLPASRISDMMDKETFLNADEALKLGFIDEIEAASEMVACLDKSRLLAWADQKPKEDKPMLEKLKALFGSELDQEIKAKADRLEKLNAEVESKEKAKAELQADREKAAIVAEMKADGRLTEAMINGEWLKTQTVDSLKAYAEIVPKIVPVVTNQLPENAPEPDENIGHKVGGVTVNKFNSNPEAK